MGKHPEKALTAIKVRNEAKPGRYADGNGLYLVIDPSGAKRWLLRIVVHGKRRDIGLGGVRLVSLAEARERALEFRKIARDGGDPLEERRKRNRVVPAFSEAAEKVHETMRTSWKNEKHTQQWINTLRQYAFPVIGHLPVDQIGSAHIQEVLSPIWQSKAETARRVRQRIGTVMDWARAAGHRDGENPILGVNRGLAKQDSQRRHHAALPYAEVPAFVAKLQESGANEITRLAFEFLILTASRTSEMLGARCYEIDDEARIWTVPAERIKAKRVHRVPLSGRSLEIIKRARILAGTSEYMFPGQSLAKPASNMVFTMIIRRMNLDHPVTAHGFRSSFRDWASETTSFPHEAAELALAHTVKNKVEAAYRRGDLLEKRREMMEAWAKCIRLGDGTKRLWQ